MLLSVNNVNMTVLVAYEVVVVIEWNLTIKSNLLVQAAISNYDSLNNKAQKALKLCLKRIVTLNVGNLFVFLLIKLPSIGTYVPP